MNKSLYSSVSLPLIVAMSVVLGLQWALVSFSLNALVERYIGSRLEHDADNLLANLRLNGTGLDLAEQAEAPVHRQPWSGHYYQIISGEDRIRSRSLWDEVLPEQAVRPGERMLVHFSGPDGTPLLALVSGYHKDDRSITVVVAEDFKEANRILSTLRWLYGVVSLIALFLLLILTRWYLQRGLLPLKAAKSQMEALERGERERLDHDDVPLEVRPFVDAINRLLTVLFRRLRRSRDAAGDLGHAIKTPLSLLSRLENDPAVSNQPAFREKLNAQIEMIRKLIERDLGLARLSGGRGTGQWFFVENDVTSLIEVMRKVHQEKELSIRSTLTPGLQINLDREDCLTLLGNLLDNACRHAEDVVQLSMELNENGLTITIEDDGPGIPESKRTDLIQRGVHGEQSVQGHGLGLSICQEIVSDYQGSISLQDSAVNGGLAVVILIPPAYGKCKKPDDRYVPGSIGLPGGDVEK
ncbi:MAG: sensor histidine kinase [Magnetococcales bacterium]|nr:sensor histidine kinase [Magnetococcales bacterium]MBF0346313.1 sensor histidine kinase [Magnetococcales bacterium]MBF0631707.1 sensor histidine kinase [Magnetococcales bacterium]